MALVGSQIFLEQFFLACDLHFFQCAHHSNIALQLSFIHCGLNGPKGEAGVPGQQSLPGLDGFKGDRGFTGPEGLPGIRDLKIAENISLATAIS